MNLHLLPKRVVRALESGSVPYTLWAHSEIGVPIGSPADFARAVSSEIQQVTKSLLLRAEGGPAYVLAVCPVTSKVDFAALSDLLKVRTIGLASERDLQLLLGQPRNGVSPLGVEYPIAIEESCFSRQTIFVGAGLVGYEVEISPRDFQTISKGVRGSFQLPAKAVLKPTK
jgi:Cys-tRNA(Pro)/Cys-tRNA(Cys) deacylase